MPKELIGYYNIRLERSSKIRIRRISKGVRIVWAIYAVLFETGDGVEYLDGTNSLTSDPYCPPCTA